MQTCELGFRHLSAPASGWEGGVVLGGSTEDVVEQYLFFSALQSVLLVWWGRCVPAVIVERERGDATGAWSFSDSFLQSVPLCCTVHQLGENNTCGS
jgi:hypothetical protein